MTSLVLTLFALGLLLTPSLIDTLTANRSGLFGLLLGIGIYIFGLVNLSSIFIQGNKNVQQLIDTVVSSCLGILSAKLVLDVLELNAIERGALRHGIGKIGSRDTISHRPSPLIEVEWNVKHLHPLVGA